MTGAPLAFPPRRRRREDGRRPIEPRNQPGRSGSLDPEQRGASQARGSPNELSWPCRRTCSLYGLIVGQLAGQALRRGPQIHDRDRIGEMQQTQCRIETATALLQAAAHVVVQAHAWDRFPLTQFGHSASQLASCLADRGIHLSARCGCMAFDLRLHFAGGRYSQIALPAPDVRVFQGKRECRIRKREGTPVINALKIA
jgi:hypothetical protein